MQGALYPIWKQSPSHSLDDALFPQQFKGNPSSLAAMLGAQRAV
jgi:hypothetical protein